MYNITAFKILKSSLIYILFEFLSTMLFLSFVTFYSFTLCLSFELAYEVSEKHTNYVVGKIFGRAKNLWPISYDACVIRYMNEICSQFGYDDIHFVAEKCPQQIRRRKSSESKVYLLNILET